MKQNSFFYISLALSIILGLVISSYIFGWNHPTANPPSGNVTLQVSSQWQTSGNDIYFNTGKVGISTTTPGYPLDVGGVIRIAGQFISTVASGTAPFVISSPTKVTNLNADLLDGYDSADLLGGSGGGAVQVTSLNTPCTITGGTGYFTLNDVCPSYGPERFIWAETGLTDSDSDGCLESENIPGFCIVRGPNGWIEPKYNQAVVVTLTASPSSSCGSSVNVLLTWSTSGASTCTASGGWSGTKATSGTETISNVTQTTSFTLTCTATGRQSGVATATYTKSGTCTEIVLYKSPTNYYGSSLTNRSIVDSYCNLATTLGCSINRAFLSLTTTDEIRDMPTNYGVPTNLPVYGIKRDGTCKTQIANNWADLLDGSILASMYAATCNEVNTVYWTYETPTGGTTDSYTCTGSAGTGYRGIPTYTSISWIADTFVQCATYQYPFLCLCVR